MADRDTNYDVELEYMEKFDCKLPTFLMMESKEQYHDELRKAIKRGRPITDDEERRPESEDILY